MRHAYFAGGCFWCITPVFQEHSGVCSVTSGYCGGTEINPSYEQVKAQQTGHRESIHILYDETAVSYPELVSLFLQYTDPFDEGGQFIDRGHSYTLAIYYASEEERAAAKAQIDALAESAGKPVAVALEPFHAFYDAEDYHQNYYLTHPVEFERELIESGRKKEGKSL